jgi:hypothetical protein
VSTIQVNTNVDMRTIKRVIGVDPDAV